MNLLEFMSVHPVLAIAALIAILLFIKSLRVANQYERSVVFRLGRFDRTAGPGLYLVWPFTEVGAEQNTMTIVMMPSEFVAMARGIGDAARILADKA